MVCLWILSPTWCKVLDNVSKAKDNLLQVKVLESHYVNEHRGTEIKYSCGDKVMLSTLNYCQQYKKKGKKRATKFFPHFNGPYEVIDVHPKTSNYTIDMPNVPNIFPTFHSSKLKPHIANDPLLFPSREFAKPQSVLTEHSLEEYFIESIIDSCCHGCGHQYLI